MERKRFKLAMERKRLKPADKVLSEGVARLATFGPAPLLEGENDANYNRVLARISAAVKPANALEAVWVWDFGYYEWNVLHLRRVKVLVINRAAQQGLFVILQDLLDYDSAKDLTEAWVRRNPP